MRDKQAREDIRGIKHNFSYLVKKLGIPHFSDGADEINLVNPEEKYNPLEDYVECSTCGCLVRKEKAIKVQEMVDKNERHASLMEKITEFGLGYPSGSINITSTTEPDMEIKTTYYCLHCNPNIKTNETKKRKKQRK